MSYPVSHGRHGATAVSISHQAGSRKKTFHATTAQQTAVRAHSCPAASIVPLPARLALVGRRRGSRAPGNHSKRTHKRAGLLRCPAPRDAKCGQPLQRRGPRVGIVGVGAELVRRCRSGRRRRCRHSTTGRCRAQRLQRAVRHHRAAFATAVARRGRQLPRLVERELDGYVDCGVLARGFARVRCGGCGHQVLVPFSCKRRGICPSCTARRAEDTAAQLVDCVLPRVPYRQWAFTFPILSDWH